MCFSGCPGLLTSDQVEGRLDLFAAGIGYGGHARPMPRGISIMIAPQPAPLLLTQGEGLRLDAVMNGKVPTAHPAGIERAEHPLTMSRSDPHAPEHGGFQQFVAFTRFRFRHRHRK